MPLETAPWRPEDHVSSPADVAEHLCAGLEEGNLDDLRFALRTIARSQGLVKVADRAGISRQSLHAILDGEADPKLSTVLALFKALGVQLSATVVARDADVASAA